MMNLKKLAHHLLLLSLTMGASLIIGLLSFGGFYVLWPSVLWASLSFLLSVAYEGEIYFQNIKGALSKLFKADYLHQEQSCLFLKDYFPHNLPRENWPTFFKEYEFSLYELHSFTHLTLDAKKRRQKALVEEKLSHMEKKFTRILNIRDHEVHLLSKEDQKLFYYLKYYKDSNQKVISLTEKYQTLIQSRQILFKATQIFSGFTALFMGIGTIYLLMETFAVIPFLAAIPVVFVPALIIPMAIIAGAAYGLLTYNTITNIITHDRIRTRFNSMRDDLKKNGLTWRNGLMLAASLTLGGLAIMLTICTAGTWWTILKETPPLFRWMRKIPTFILGTLLPLITSTAALAFNLENSAESLDMIEEASKEKINLKEQWKAFKERLNQLRQRENWGQLLNPFRLILITTILPLRMVLFLGHLISIGVTADRVPGLPKIVSALLGIISEFFEDMHYFVKHKAHLHDTRTLLKERLEENGEHNHDNDLPTRLLKLIAAPLYALSAIWNYVMSQFNTKPHQLTWTQSFQKTTEPVLPVATPVYEIPTIATSVAIAAKEEIQNNPKHEIKKLKHTQQTFPNCPCCMPYYFFEKTKLTEPTPTVAYVIPSAEAPIIKTKPLKATHYSENSNHFFKTPPMVSNKKPFLTKTPQPFFNAEFCTFIEPAPKNSSKIKRAMKTQEMKPQLEEHLELSVKPG